MPKLLTLVFLFTTGIASVLPAEASPSCAEFFSPSSQLTGRRPKLVVVSGTNRDGSVTLKVASQVVEIAKARGVDVTLLDIAEVPPETYSGTSYFDTPASFQAQFDRPLNEADAIVFVFPEYHGTYPGILGTFLNYAQVSFSGKPVGMVGLSAGVLGGQKGAEHLASTMRHRRADLIGETQVNIPKVDEAMKDGRLVNSDILKRLDSSLDVLVKRVEKSLEADHTLNEFLDVAKDSSAALKYGLTSNVSVHGKLADVERDASGSLIYLRWQGPTELLDESGSVIDGQGKEKHSSGFSIPVGKVKTATGSVALSEVKSGQAMEAIGLKVGARAKLEYESGVVVSGILSSVVYASDDGSIEILIFKDATAKNGSRVLFEPAWGDFDIAVSEKLTGISR